MNTTIEIPDALFRLIKDKAALSGKSLKAFVIEALREALERGEKDPDELMETGWRSVFGKAKTAQVKQVDAIVDAGFSSIDLESWK
ncbi:MAG: hypothetical protein JRF33_26345 [Deltaproteobacteria bacterium]|nr:hypothetical protein [Deltaproteobacteria bacterium]